MAKATNFQKLSMEMTRISGQCLHRGPGAEPIMGVGGQGASGALQPETKHLHTCRSILLAILFKNVLKMLKRSQFVTFLPHPPLYQLEASCGNLGRV